jgi:hypothetical protein
MKKYNAKEPDLIGQIGTDDNVPVIVAPSADVSMLSYQLKKESIALGRMIGDLPKALKNLVDPLTEIYVETMADLSRPNREMSLNEIGNWYVDAVYIKRAAYHKVLEYLLNHDAIVGHPETYDALERLTIVDEKNKFSTLGECYDFSAVAQVLGNNEFATHLDSLQIASESYTFETSVVEPSAVQRSLLGKFSRFRKRIEHAIRNF